MTSTPSASLKLKKTKITDTNITLSHGSGGRAMRDLINEIFVNNFDNNLLAPLEDQARFEIKDLAKIGDRLAFTTDSYVVSPLFFPGGDIGSLAVNGTVNDLAVGGAIPLYLSCSFILRRFIYRHPKNHRYQHENSRRQSSGKNRHRGYKSRSQGTRGSNIY